MQIPIAEKASTGLTIFLYYLVLGLLVEVPFETYWLGLALGMFFNYLFFWYDIDSRVKYRLSKGLAGESFGIAVGTEGIV